MYTHVQHIVNTQHGLSAILFLIRESSRVNLGLVALKPGTIGTQPGAMQAGLSRAIDKLWKLWLY